MRSTTRSQAFLAYLCAAALLAGGCHAPAFPVTATAPDGVLMESGLLEIQILVLGRDKPLRNVQVEIYKEQFEPVPGELIAATVTGGDGIARVKLSPGSYGVWVRALDMDAQWRYLGPTEMTFSRDQRVIVQMIPAH